MSTNASAAQPQPVSHPRSGDYTRLATYESPAARVLEYRTAAATILDASCELVPNLAFAHICFLAEGTIEERRGSERVLRVAPHLRVSPPWDAHHVHCGEAHARCFYIHVPPEAEQDERVGDVRYSSAAHLTALGWQLAAETRAGIHASPLEIESLATELVAGLQFAGDRAAPQQPPRWLSRVRDLLEESRGSGEVRLGQLAAEAGVHRVHLTRTFRACFGLAPGEYVRRTRFRRARALLSGTTFSLARVAAESGYYDQSHLVREFRRACRMTPSAYRRLARGR